MNLWTSILFVYLFDSVPISLDLFKFQCLCFFKPIETNESGKVIIIENCFSRIGKPMQAHVLNFVLIYN